MKNIKLKTNSYMAVHFRKKDPTTKNSLKAKLFFENVDNSQTVFKTSKFEGTLDNNRIENIILAQIWATIFCGGFGSTRC